ETDTFEDLVEAGVIDPTKVVRAALQNAASVAGLMLTTEAIMAERPKPIEPLTPYPQSPGGMGPRGAPPPPDHWEDHSSGALMATMAARQGAPPPAWLGRPRWRLLLDVLGGIRANVDKLVQLVGLLAAYVRPSVLRARFERLRALGHIDVVPTWAQAVLAGR